MQGISFTIANPNSIPTPGRQEVYYDNVEKSNLLFSFTQLPEGNTTIYIQWGGIPGYNEGWKARNISKKSPAPEILAFTTSNSGKTESIPFGKSISLDWMTFAIPEVKLRCAENPELNLSLKVPATGTEPALFYCGGVRPGAPGTNESCGSLANQPITPLDPVNNFYLQGFNGGVKVGEEVGPVTIRLDNYPAPVLSKQLQPTNAILNTTENNEPVYYFNTPGATVQLTWELENPQVAKEIILLDPTGNSLKEIPPQKQGTASITLQKEGIYTIRIIGKDGKEVSQGIILKTVSKRLVETSYISAITYKGAIPEPGPVFVITYGTKDVNHKAKLKLVYTYQSGILSLSDQMQLTFTESGKGQIAFTPSSYNPTSPVDFQWSLTEQGNLNIQLKDGSNWELLLLAQSESPQQLFFQLATAQLTQLLKDKKIVMRNLHTPPGVDLAPDSIALWPVPRST